MPVTLQDIRKKREEWKTAVKAYEDMNAATVSLYDQLQKARQARDELSQTATLREGELERFGMIFAKDDSEDAVQNTLTLNEKEVKWATVTVDPLTGTVSGVTDEGIPF